MAALAAAAAGEAAWAMASNLISMADGSTILVQLDKPSYNAGETMTGRVIAYVCSPVVCDEVAVKVRLKSKTEWDAEVAHTRYEGEGEERKAIVTYTHEEKKGKHTVFKDKIVVSKVDHMLPPGTYAYPFSYTIPSYVPGVSKFKRKQMAHDPEWKKEGREIEHKATLVFTVKACLQTAGMFSRELKSRQEITVNPFFDWSKMQPARASNSGQVLICCCIDKGKVTLTSTHDKAAYQAGETALCQAIINNESTVNITNMVAKLTRSIQMSDGKGAMKSWYDVMATATFQGVPEKSTATRDMPLRLSSSLGPLLPSIDSPHLKISYKFEAECSIPWAPDIEAHLPLVIYQPSPPVSGMAAFTQALPPAVMAYVQANPMAMVAPGGVPMMGHY